MPKAHSKSAKPLVIAGRKPVRDAIKRQPERLECLLIRKGLGGIGAITSAAAAAGIPVRYVPNERLKAVSGGIPHQGVAALAAEVGYTDLNKMLAAAAPNLDSVKAVKPILLALDRIQDPRNFGAIIRTAAAAGAAGIIVPITHSAPITAAVVKASSGTALTLPIARTMNMPVTLEAVKERGYYVYGIVSKGGIPFEEADLNRPLVFVVGNESAGLRPAIAEACDLTVSIPMSAGVESLNVSVATGVMVFMAVFQRLVRTT